MATRDEVFQAINTERSYQEMQWPGRDIPGHDNQLTIGEFILLIEEYAAKARLEWSQESKPEMNALNTMRKIGGIAVNCMEQHGAPKRELHVQRTISVNAGVGNG